MSPRTPRRAEIAEVVWGRMQAVVEGEERKYKLRIALGFGGGAGRVKALFQLREGPITLGELAEARGVDASYATLIVDKLESMGLVERLPHPEDRRRKLVALTAAGWDAVKVAEETLGTPPESFSRLTVAELAQLSALLERLE